jgi:hypothetical protein
VFAGALVVVVSIPAFWAIGTNMDSIMEALRGHMKGNIKAAQMAEINAASMDQLFADAKSGKLNAIIDVPYTGPQVNGSQVLPPPQSGQQQICMEGGFCLNMAPPPNSSTVSTVGANGNDFLLSYVQNLDQILQQLNATPQVDDQLKQLITNLANQGHGIAALENQATSAIASGAPQDTKASLSNSISMTQDQFWAAKAELDQYLAANAGALPPALKGVIVSGAGNIDEIVAVVRDKLTPLDYTLVQGNNVYDTYTGQTTFQQTNVANVNVPPSVELSAKMSEVNSNGICGTGGYASQCYKNLYNAAPPPPPPAPTPPLVTFVNGTTGPTYLRYLQDKKNQVLDVSNQTQVVQTLIVSSAPPPPPAPIATVEPPPPVTPYQTCVASYMNTFYSGERNATIACKYSLSRMGYGSKDFY